MGETIFLFPGSGHRKRAMSDRLRPRQGWKGKGCHSRSHPNPFAILIASLFNKSSRAPPTAPTLRPAGSSFYIQHSPFAEKINHII
ncbi:hypothetical protein HMPREF0262_03277 [Clostridium sp. ATCC 29733]|nr:hypothetical protein HMPREF0262_03277 [Clostridium sp. ATCC 29733]